MIHVSVKEPSGEEYLELVSQELLESLYGGRANICCPCNDVPMSIVKVKNSYHLRSYPEKKSMHLEGCLFHGKSFVRVNERGEAEIKSFKR